MLEDPNFEKDYWSRTATGISKVGHDSIRFMNWLAQYDRSYYGIITYYVPISSALTCLNEISQR